MGVTVDMNGVPLAQMSQAGAMRLNTAGKYVAGNIGLQYTGGGGEGYKLVSATVEMDNGEWSFSGSGVEPGVEYSVSGEYSPTTGVDYSLSADGVVVETVNKETEYELSVEFASVSVTATRPYYAGAVLEDHAINDIILQSGECTLVLPASVQGVARDFYVRLTHAYPGSTSPVLSAPSGESVSWYGGTPVMRTEQPAGQDCTYLYHVFEVSQGVLHCDSVDAAGIYSIYPLVVPDQSYGSYYLKNRAVNQITPSNNTGSVTLELPWHYTGGGQPMTAPFQSDPYALPARDMLLDVDNSGNSVDVSLEISGGDVQFFMPSGWQSIADILTVDAGAIVRIGLTEMRMSGSYQTRFVVRRTDLTAAVSS